MPNPPNGLMPARSAQSLSLINEGVFFIEFMTMLAMSFPGIYGRNPIASKSIYFASNCLKMIGIYTNWVSAKMVYCKPFRYWANNLLIRISMRSNKLPIKPEVTVRAILLHGSSPDPARFGLVDFGPKSDARVATPNSVSVAASQEASVVHPAESFSVRVAGAIGNSAKFNSHVPYTTNGLLQCL